MPFKLVSRSYRIIRPRGTGGSQIRLVRAPKAAPKPKAPKINIAPNPAQKPAKTKFEQVYPTVNKATQTVKTQSGQFEQVYPTVKAGGDDIRVRNILRDLGI